ncbi:hypothetical protein HDU80_002795, partial [Chytriomyces hyalinus]
DANVHAGGMQPQANENANSNTASTSTNAATKEASPSESLDKIVPNIDDAFSLNANMQATWSQGLLSYDKEFGVEWDKDQDNDIDIQAQPQTNENGSSSAASTSAVMLIASSKNTVNADMQATWTQGPLSYDEEFGFEWDKDQGNDADVPQKNLFAVLLTNMRKNMKMKVALSNLKVSYKNATGKNVIIIIADTCRFFRLQFLWMD